MIASSAKTGILRDSSQGAFQDSCQYKTRKYPSLRYSVRITVCPSFVLTATVCPSFVLTATVCPSFVLLLQYALLLC